MTRFSDALDDAQQRHEEEGPRPVPSRLVLGIDPGPTVCGVALYDTDAQRLLWSAAALDVEETVALLQNPGALYGVASVERSDVALFAVERVKAGRFAGDSYLLTAEVVGRCWQACDSEALPARLLTRTDVLRQLDLLNVRGNRDAAVTREMCARHGGTMKAAKGRKAAPGPLFGIASHAWQALALAIAASEIDGRLREE